MSAWVVFRESGEYSDHRFTVLCVAKTEADAREAVAWHAIRYANQCPVRLTRATDERHADGWFVVLEHGEMDDSAGPYDTTFGFQRVDVWSKR